jgi:NhaP-type Na+/H+ or K+/H+ antiporter
MTAETFAATVALIGIVILVSSLLSGIVERTGVPQVAIFLILGAALGPYGLGVFDLALESTALRTLATLALVLVLFSDAISLDLGEIRRNVRLALLVLGPGSLIPAALIAGSAWYLLGLHWAAAAIVGASLASTDPVLLRGLLRRRDVPTTARLALRLESGMNDVVLLPIVVVSMMFLHGATGGAAEEHRSAARVALGLLVLGPGAGVVAGLVGITLLDRVRKSVGVRRDYESLYALGVAFTAFAAAEAAGGSGFLAAFAAGITVAALDVELCDCFLDYGEATAEMFLLLTFVAFGGSLIWRGLDIINARTIAFALLALGVRTIVLFPVLTRAGVDGASRRFIAWFGPRGLSTLLLVLLPVFDGVAGAEQLFILCCLVVLLSVLLHGGAIAALVRWRRDNPTATHAIVPEAAVSTPRITGNLAPLDHNAALPGQTPAPTADGEQPAALERITLDELRDLRTAGEQVVLLDVRTQRTFDSDPFIASGAVRMPPDDAVRLATAHRIPWKATLVAYCA